MNDPLTSSQDMRWGFKYHPGLLLYSYFIVFTRKIQNALFQNINFRKFRLKLLLLYLIKELFHPKLKILYMTVFCYQNIYMRKTENQNIHIGNLDSLKTLGPIPMVDGK